MQLNPLLCWSTYYSSPNTWGFTALVTAPVHWRSEYIKKQKQARNVPPACAPVCWSTREKATEVVASSEFATRSAAQLAHPPAGDRPAWSWEPAENPRCCDTPVPGTERGEKDQAHMHAPSRLLSPSHLRALPGCEGLPAVVHHPLSSWTTAACSPSTPWAPSASGVSQQELAVRGSSLWKSAPNSQQQSRIRTAFYKKGTMKWAQVKQVEG